jgi:integrase
MKKKKKIYATHEGVRKRCAHDSKEWDLCACPWFFAVTHQGKRQRGKILGVTNERDARTAYQLIVARVRNGQPPFDPVAVTDGLTVAQLGDDWLNLPRDRKPSVIDGYREHLRAHINPVLGQRLVTAVTPDECEALVLGLKRRRGELPLSASTKERIAVTVQALFGFAVKKRKRLDNPAAGLPAVVKDPNASTDDDVIDPQDHTKYFPADEAQHLLATIERSPALAPWYLFVRVGIECGLRMGELAGLRYEHINWRGGYLNVQAAFSKRRHTTPKNRKNRTVSTSRELRARLRLRWREHRDSTRLVFGSAQPVDIGNFRNRTWRDILEAADLDYRKPHAMRHTHTSLLLQAGESPAKVAAEAGRSLQVTMAVYAHFLPAPARAGAERMAEMLAGQKDTVSFRKGSRGNDGPRQAIKGQGMKQKA